jgi:hypothetical protein
MSTLRSDKCGFCGKSREAVRVLIASPESAICEECIIVALDTLTLRWGRRWRLAFFAFGAIAGLGRRRTSE